MNVWFTEHEGGIWQYWPDVDLQILAEFMYPHFDNGAILFPCGMIYDNVLARLLHDPWRYEPKTRQFLDSTLSAEKTH